MNKSELLAPAGNLEKLKWAVAYGADAVYFGTEFGSLRNFAGNFSLDAAQQGIDYLHDYGCQGYATLNIYPFSDEYEQVKQVALALDEMGIDALIVADLGVLSLLHRLELKAALHISTQANTMSWQTIKAYRELGAKRVNLARELSLEHIREIQQHLPPGLETEVFIHGAVCFSFSGRCAISDYLTGHRANHGECKHPCRWKYTLMEEKRPGEYMPVFEDNRGLYFYNSKDLALHDYVPELQTAGVSSFKIEGRMKSIHYIASTVSFYRQIIDGRVFSPDEVEQWLNRIPNRGYSAGFMKGGIGPEDGSIFASKSSAQSRLVGNVSGHTAKNESIIEVRNTIHAADQLEVLQPDGSVTEIQMPDLLTTTEEETVVVVNNSRFVVLRDHFPKYTLFRRVVAEKGRGLY